MTGWLRLVLGLSVLLAYAFVRPGRVRRLTVLVHGALCRAENEDAARLRMPVARCRCCGQYPTRRPLRPR